MPHERNLTKDEARAIARGIVESGLVDEWEARAAAYNEAVADFGRWLEGLPEFPPHRADRWDFYQGAYAIAEELVALLRRTGR